MAGSWSRRARVCVAVVAAVLAAVGSGAGAGPLGTGRVERVSVGTGGTQATAFHVDPWGLGNVWYPSVSANGRFVSFTSDAFGLARPCNALQRFYLGSQVYVRDLARGTTELVTARPDGCPGSAGGISSSSVSADGRYVAFVTGADDIVPGFQRTDPWYLAVFVRDRVTRRTVAVSVGYDGKANNMDAINPSISADGRYVAFESGASNLVKGDPRRPDNLAHDVYVRDLRLGRTERIGAVHPRAHGIPKGNPSISGDGRYVTFECDDPALAGYNYGDITEPITTYSGGPTQVYVYDRVTHRTDLMSRSDSGFVGNHESYSGPSGQTISADGRYVVFASQATNLVPEDEFRAWGDVEPDLTWDVYVYDRVAKHLSRASLGPGGVPGDYGSGWPAISADGRWIVFHSGANNLGDVDTSAPVGDFVPGQIDSGYDVYLHDRVTGENRLVSRATDGTQGNYSSYNATVSADGRTVVFVSIATNLVPGDTNAEEDVFAYHVLTDGLPVVLP